MGRLTTVGRKTGLPRTVELRLVYRGGRFYASSSRIEAKHWCRNLIANPAVEVSVGRRRVPCVAGRVTDEELRRSILALRGSPASLDRVVFEMTPR